jgi:Rhs element Vgr protein
MPQQQLFVPNTSTNNVVTYQVMINGNVANPSYELLSMVVTREVNKVPAARLVFKDGDPSQSTFALSEAGDFAPGTTVAVNLGRDGTNTQTFKGIIIRHAIRVKENGQSELTVDCRDEVVRMTVGRHSKYYTQILDSDLLNTLVSAYPDLSCNMTATTFQHEELVQHHLTDWDFMLLRAEANGMLVNVIDGVVNIAAPQTTGTPVLQVNFGSSILEFEAEMDVRNQWNNVEARAWDYHNQVLFQADSSGNPAWTEPGNITASQLAQAINLTNYELHHSGYLQDPELQSWADGLMLRSLLAKICGRAKCTGFSGVDPGDMLTVTGVGARFNGNVFVTAVRQEVGNGMWDTHIQFGLSPRRYAELFQDIDDRPAAGLAGGIRGLQIGVAVQLQGDPEGQGRIMVKVPMIDNTSQGIWTRIATLDAGSSRGSFFLPEVNDEVIVGFINDDPSQAVMLGMLNSSAKPSKLPNTTANNTKGFTSRSGMQILFDDGETSVTVITPNQNQIVLDDTQQNISIKDQNGNSITMDSTGITLSSSSGQVTVSAGTNLSLTATADFSASGATASLTGDTSASITATTVSIN